VLEILYNKTNVEGLEINGVNGSLEKDESWLRMLHCENFTVAIEKICNIGPRETSETEARPAKGSDQNQKEYRNRRRCCARELQWRSSPGRKLGRLTSMLNLFD